MTSLRSAARFLLRWVWHALAAVLLVLATLVLGKAFQSRTLPDLKPWHRAVPAAELKAAEMDRGMTLAEYLRREGEVFAEVRRIESQAAPADRTPGNRYAPGSPLNPARFATDWNRSYEIVPPEVRGGVLLVHGLTDSPYSVRTLARTFAARGFYALALRMPGHGTVPAALTAVDKDDWLAAVRLGVRQVRGRIGAGKPLLLAGYSNGGALVVEYSLEALARPELPRADRLLLLSPMIGISPLARIARVTGLLSVFPYFEKSAWLEVLPEPNPFKYNSFPNAAATQSYRLTRLVQKDLRQAAESGAIARLPPILAFQSLVDATVSTRAVIDLLFVRLPGNGSELVLFDLNRVAAARPFLHEPRAGTLDGLLRAPGRRYRLTWISNVDEATLDVAERTAAPGETAARQRPLGLAWPRDVYSLSHVALPFPPDDPLFGSAPDLREDFGFRLGLFTPRGERGVLTVPVDSWMRLNCNPFYPYLDERVRAWIAGPGSGPP
jgi:alpha-beta hydrolase superfamily lysophospholipase